MNRHPTLVIAHRGASGQAPENTLSAFRRAVELEVDAVELDVRATADGVPVVVHDETLARTAHDPRSVAELTLAELQQLDVGSWFGSGFEGERIPTLREVLDLLSSRVQTYIEIKVSGIEEEVIRVVQEAGATRHTMIHSFDLESVVRCRQLLPEMGGAWIQQLPDEDPHGHAPALGDRTLAAGIGTLSICAANLTGEILLAWRRRGLSVFVWTVDTPASMEALLGAGIDGLITNHPERALSLLDRTQEALSS